MATTDGNDNHIQKLEPEALGLVRKLMGTYVKQLANVLKTNPGTLAQHFAKTSATFPSLGKCLARFTPNPTDLAKFGSVLKYAGIAFVAHDVSKALVEERYGDASVTVLKFSASWYASAVAAGLLAGTAAGPAAATAVIVASGWAASKLVGYVADAVSDANKRFGVTERIAEMVDSVKSWWAGPESAELPPSLKTDPDTLEVHRYLREHGPLTDATLSGGDDEVFRRMQAHLGDPTTGPKTIADLFAYSEQAHVKVETQTLIEELSSDLADPASDPSTHAAVRQDLAALHTDLATRNSSIELAEHQLRDRLLAPLPLATQPTDASDRAAARQREADSDRARVEEAARRCHELAERVRLEQLERSRASAQQTAHVSPASVQQQQQQQQKTAPVIAVARQ